MVTTREYEVLRDINQRIADIQTDFKLHCQETHFYRIGILSRLDQLEARPIQKPGFKLDLKALAPLWIPLATLVGLLVANVPLKEAILTTFK